MIERLLGRKLMCMYMVYAGSDKMVWKKKYIFFGPNVLKPEPVLLFTFVDDIDNIEEKIRMRINEHNK